MDIFDFDLFLSFTGKPHRDLTREVARILHEKNLRVFFDEETIENADRWIESLEKGLKKARCLAALVPEGPSGNQRSEIESFRDFRSKDPRRLMVIVYMDQLPSDASFLDLQGAKGEGLSPAAIASLIETEYHQKLNPTPSIAEPHWTPPEALAAYGKHCIDRHSKLVPYFVGANDLLLKNVFVQLEVANTPRRTSIIEPEGPKNHEPLDSTPVPLESLLLAKTAGPCAPRILLVGDPGAGKTTLCRALTRRLAEENERIPIFLPLAGLTSGKFEPLAAAASEFLGAEALSTPRAEVLLQSLAATINTGNAVLFLDGLDEVDSGRTDDIVREITAYADQHRKLPILVSGRSIAFERSEFPTDYTRVRVQPLPGTRQDELLHNLLDASLAREVRSHIDRHPALADLAQSPLLLTLLAVVARDTSLSESKLPKTRTKLYDTVVTLLLRRGFGIHKQGVHDTQSARRLLQVLSFELHTKGGEAWTPSALSDVLTTLRERNPRTNFLVKENWETNDRFLDDMGRNSGILGPHDAPNLPWRYLHRSLREFLAAEELASRPEPEVLGYLKTWLAEVEADEKAKRDSPDDQRKAKEKKRAKASRQTPTAAARPDPQRWGEVFALYAGLAADPAPVITALGQQSPPLALRTIRAIDALKPAQLLDHLLQFEGWNDQELSALLDHWDLAPPARKELLNSAIRPELPIPNLGLLWCALEDLGDSPDRQDFFTRCGLWPEGGPPAPDLVAIPPNGQPFEFRLGSPDGVGHGDEHPQVTVRLSPFRLARRTVTWRDFNQFRQTAPDSEVPKEQTPDHPVTSVSWWSAYLYCRWLGGSLPIEAQWEGACRAGTQTAYWFGDDPSLLPRYGWFAGNSGNRTHPSDPKHANPWGLEEMHGNVWEWCLDNLRGNYSGLASAGSPKDPCGWPRDFVQVVRGGSCRGDADRCRSARRVWREPGNRSDSLGFRVAFPAAPSFDP